MWTLSTIAVFGVWNIIRPHNSKWIRHFTFFLEWIFGIFFSRLFPFRTCYYFFASKSYAWNQRPSKSVTKIENLKARIYHYFFFKKKRLVACNQFLHSAVKTVWGFSSLGHLLCLLTDGRFPIQLRMEKATEWELDFDMHLACSKHSEPLTMPYP